MSQKTFIGIFVGFVCICILANASLFVVKGIDQAVVVRFGKIERVIDGVTGLYMKMPIIDDVIRLDRRVMSLSSGTIQVPTSASEFIAVSTIAQWRIADPATFIKTAKTEAAGAALLEQVLTASLRSQAAMLTIDKIVGGELALDVCKDGRERCKSMPDARRDDVRRRAADYGIDLRDFRVLRVSHAAKVRREVENRMIAERLKASEQIYSEGETASAQIAAQAELESQRIVSDAERTRDTLLVNNDRDLREQGLKVFGSDPEFYRFFATVTAYRASLGGNTTLMLPSDAEFFRYLSADR